MHYLFALSLALFFSAGLQAEFQQDEPARTPGPVQFSSPLAGQALQGSVPVILDSAGETFQGAELTFTYQVGSADTWFLIYESAEPVSGGELVQWDTTTLTDGEYALRLVLTSPDGSQTTLVVPNLRVRNYTAVETGTPVPTNTSAPGDTPVPSSSPTPSSTPIPATGTPLPPNPAQITNQAIASSLAKGALGAIAALSLLGAYTVLRNALRR